MAGNSFGQLFRITTFGESHGPALGVIVDGCPPGLVLNEKDIQIELDKRRPGKSRFTSKRQEPDQVQILSGIFKGQTTGTPITLQIINQDHRPEDYREITDKFRPGHADFTYHHKYGCRDPHGGGRASARETAMRVAAGAIAQKYLEHTLGIKIGGYVRQIGCISARHTCLEQVSQNPFWFADPHQLDALTQYFVELQKQGDSVGALVQVYARGVPVGLGEPVFDRLDADIAKAMMSINAVKAVAIGDGFDVVHQQGSQHRDELTSDGFLSNHAGGVLGGISSGQDLSISIALKPTSSIRKPCQTLSTAGQVCMIETKGRHDPCVGIRAVPVACAMLACVLMDHWLRHRAQNAPRVAQVL